MNCILALGFFDALHVGHKKIIEDTVLLARQTGVKPAALIMEGDLNRFTRKTVGLVYTTEERKNLFIKFGINTLVSFKLDASFLSRSKEDFLETLTGDYGVKGFVCGRDFTFGKSADGNVDYLSAYCKEKGLNLKVVDDVLDGDKKVSARNVKKMLLDGNVKAASKFLSEPFFYTAQNVQLTKDGFLVEFDCSKIILKNGKYRGYLDCREKKEYLTAYFNGINNTFTVIFDRFGGNLNEKIEINDKIYITDGIL